MRAALAVAVVCAAAGTATAGPQFAALDFETVSPLSGSAIVASGEGSHKVGLSGSLGPFSPGSFSVVFGLSFDSFSVNGDGVAALLSFHASYGSGQLHVTDMGLTANLFDGGNLISSLTAPGEIAQGSSTVSNSFEVLSVAQSFSRGDANPFEFIGDNGSIQVRVDFMWSGAQNGDSLSLSVMDGSEVSYLTFVPAPGVASVMALGACIGMRRRRN